MQSQQPIPVQGLQQQPVVYYPGVVNRNNNNGRVENYRWKQSKVLGVLHILIGIICIICNSVSIGVFNYGYHYPGTVVNLVGYGIWNSILFIIAGILGLVAAKKQTKCSIISFMVMCIISACFTVIVFSLATIGAFLASARGPQGFVGCDKYPYAMYPYQSRSLAYGEEPCPQKDLAIAAESLMAFMAVMEAIVAIWGSVICCKAVCCCAPSQVMFIAQYSTQQTYPVDSPRPPFQQVSYYALPTSNGQNVHFLANTNPVPPPLPATLDQNTEMTWNPPPYNPSMPVPTYEQATANKNGTFS